MSGWLAIDGSHGEGGGQLARMAMAMAAITGSTLHLMNIRAGRPKPGLKAQHLTAIRAVAAISGGELEGAELGAAEIRFRPGHISGGNYRFDVGTAGSIALVLQALLPVALHADGPCRLSISGGTDVKMAPPLDYLRLVFLPWLERMGVKVRIVSVRRGYYPRGGGEVCLLVTPNRHLISLQVDTPGPLRAIRGIAHVARLPPHIPERMAAAACAQLADFGPVHIEARVLGEGEAFGTGGALLLVADTAHSHLGAATVAERGVPAERLGEAVSLALRTDLEARATVDVHAADQLLIYAALSRGPSSFTVRQVSQHAQTVMWLIEQFLPVRFEVDGRDGVQRIAVYAVS